MDRALKERIVGAIVLVVIAVLVVPVFLDGPADERTIVTETVTLPGQGEQNTRRQTIVLERDRDQPVPAGDAAGAGAGNSSARDTGDDTRKPEPRAPVASRTAEPVAAVRKPSPPPATNPDARQASAEPADEKQAAAAVETRSAA